VKTVSGADDQDWIEPTWKVDRFVRYLKPRLVGAQGLREGEPKGEGMKGEQGKNGKLKGRAAHM
jgi:hypothetical protein